MRSEIGQRRPAPLFVFPGSDCMSLSPEPIPGTVEGIPSRSERIPSILRKLSGSSEPFSRTPGIGAEYLAIGSWYRGIVTKYPRIDAQYLGIESKNHPIVSLQVAIASRYRGTNFVHFRMRPRVFRTPFSTLATEFRPLPSASSHRHGPGPTLARFQRSKP